MSVPTCIADGRGLSGLSDATLELFLESLAEARSKLDDVEARLDAADDLDILALRRAARDLGVASRTCGLLEGVAGHGRAYLTLVDSSKGGA